MVFAPRYCSTLCCVVLCCVVLCCVVLCLSCQGPVGPAGKDGVNGNANVQFISFTLTSRDWPQGTGTARQSFTYTRTVSQITADVANNGAVLVYQSTDGTVWRALPFSQVYSQTSNFSFEFNVFITSGALGISIRDTDPNNPGLPTIAASRYRAVIMAPSPITAAKLQNIDVRNYDAVVAALATKGVE